MQVNKRARSWRCAAPPEPALHLPQRAAHRKARCGWDRSHSAQLPMPSVTTDAALGAARCPPAPPAAAQACTVRLGQLIICTSVLGLQQGPALLERLTSLTCGSAAAGISLLCASCCPAAAAAAPGSALKGMLGCSSCCAPACPITFDRCAACSRPDATPGTGCCSSARQTFGPAAALLTGSLGLAAAPTPGTAAAAACAVTGAEAPSAAHAL